MSEDLVRRLTTILAADVAGYSRRMSENEEAKLRTYNAVRTLVDAIIAKHRGRIFNTAGDAILAEFASAVDAVRAAVDVQEAIASENRGVPEPRQLKFRIGVNVGDVMINGNDLLGDGVNVAARLEGLADPGGICISRSVAEQIEGKMTLGLVDLGDREFKNISRPVRAFQVLVGGEGGGRSVAAAIKVARTAKSRVPLAASLAGLVLVAAASAYWFMGRDASHPGPTTAANPSSSAAPAAPMAKPVDLASLKPRDEFQDCDSCPRMIVIPAGAYERGATEEELAKLGVPSDRTALHSPKHTVVIDRPFALGKFKVTRREFAAFLGDSDYKMPKGCYYHDGQQWKLDAAQSWETTRFAQTDRDPVLCVSSDDMQAYLGWLSRKTGRRYRLPSETEWEHAARGGTRTPYYWGESLADVCLHENVGDLSAKERFAWRDSGVPCRDNHVFTSPAGSFRPNPYGLFDIAGNAREVLADCRTQSYENAPRDSAASRAGDCSQRTARAVHWGTRDVWRVWIGTRDWVHAGSRNNNAGFRIAVSLP